MSLLVCGRATQGRRTEWEYALPASFELRKLRSQHLCCLHGKEELASEMRKLQSAKRWRLERSRLQVRRLNLPHFQVPPGIC